MMSSHTGILRSASSTTNSTTPLSYSANPPGSCGIQAATAVAGGTKETVADARSKSNTVEHHATDGLSHNFSLGAGLRQFAAIRSGHQSNLLGAGVHRRASRDDVMGTKLRMQSFRNGTASFGEIAEILSPRHISSKPEPDCKCPEYLELFQAYQHLEHEVMELRIRNMALDHRVSNLQRKSRTGSSMGATTQDGESVSGASISSISRLSHISSLKPSQSVLQRNALNRYSGMTRWRGSMASTSTTATGGSSRRHSSLDNKFVEGVVSNHHNMGNKVEVRKVHGERTHGNLLCPETLGATTKTDDASGPLSANDIKSTTLKKVSDHKLDSNQEESPPHHSRGAIDSKMKVHGITATVTKPGTSTFSRLTAVGTHNEQQQQLKSEPSHGITPQQQVASSSKGGSLSPVQENKRGSVRKSNIGNENGTESATDEDDSVGPLPGAFSLLSSEPYDTRRGSYASILAGKEPEIPIRAQVELKHEHTGVTEDLKPKQAASVQLEDEYTTADDRSSYASSSAGNSSRADAIGRQVMDRRMLLAQERRIEDASSQSRSRSSRSSGRTGSTSSSSSSESSSNTGGTSGGNDSEASLNVNDSNRSSFKLRKYTERDDSFHATMTDDSEATTECSSVIGLCDPEIPGAIRLPRGGVYVQTKVGPIQFGIPPETIKDSMELGLSVPSCYIVPKIRFNIKMGINVCEIEFPAYYNFFLANRMLNLVCTKDVQAIVKSVLDETLEGPEPHQLHVDSEYGTKLRVANEFSPMQGFGDEAGESSNQRRNSIRRASAASHSSGFGWEPDKRYDYAARPDHEKEIKFFKQPRNGRVISTDTLMSFTDLVELCVSHPKYDELVGLIPSESMIQAPSSAEDDTTVLVADLGSDVYVLDIGQEYIVIQDNKVLCQIPVFFTSWVPSTILSNPSIIGEYSTLFDPPDFGITVLGSSHGFDAQGATSGFVLWIHRKGIMIDPPPNATERLQAAGIIPGMINGIILTHCHADHDAGTFQKFLKEGRVTLITTKTIFDSFVRKYSLISGFTDTFLLKLFETKLVKIGEPLHWGGGSLRFFYSLHALPCIGFEALVGGKSFIYSSDTYYDPKGLDDLCAQGFISPARRDALMAFPWEYDLVLHEAGIPPIHTPTSALNALPENVKNNLYIIHINEADAKRSGLRLARAGVENTISIPIETHTHQPSALLLQVLHSTELSRTFNILQASDLLLLCDVADYNPGEYVCQKGDVAEFFYIILSGFCAVTLPVDNFAGNTSSKGDGLHKVFGPGEYLGELALLENTERTASIRALTNVKLIKLNHFGFRYLLETTPGLEDRMDRLSRIRCSLSWQAIEQNSVLCRLGSMQRSNLQAIMRSVQVSQGQVLWHSDTPVTRAYLVASGSLGFAEMEDDLQPFFAGALLCDLASMYNHRASLQGEVPEGPINSNVTLVAQEQSLVYAIDADDIIEYLDQNPGIFINLVHSVVVE